jgi:beta-glucosidase
MPGTGLGGVLGEFFGDELVNVTRAGTVSEARLNDMAIRILTPYYHLGQDVGFPETNFDSSSLAKDGLFATNQNVNVQADHWKIVRQIGEESATCAPLPPAPLG